MPGDVEHRIRILERDHHDLFELLRKADDAVGLAAQDTYLARTIQGRTTEAAPPPPPPPPPTDCPKCGTGVMIPSVLNLDDPVWGPGQLTLDPATSYIRLRRTITPDTYPDLNSGLCDGAVSSGPMIIDYILDCFVNFGFPTNPALAINYVWCAGPGSFAGSTALKFGRTGVPPGTYPAASTGIGAIGVGSCVPFDMSFTFDFSAFDPVMYAVYPGQTSVTVRVFA